jgi:hypothetical protein
LSPPCPWCDHKELVRHNGEGHVTCEHCHRIIEEKHYDWFRRGVDPRGGTAPGGSASRGGSRVKPEVPRFSRRGLVAMIGAAIVMLAIYVLAGWWAFSACSRPLADLVGSHGRHL